MSIHMQKQIDQLRRLILSLAADVERALQLAVRAVEARNVDQALEVIGHDEVIDKLEIDIEEACLHVLALEQPVAMDLRFIVTVMKMNNDLERIADIAVNISQQACHLARKPPVDVSRFLPGMAEEVLTMLRQALDSLFQMDVELADAVRRADDRVDDLHRRTFEKVEKAIREEPERCSELIHVLSISRNLERAADYATNIAEDVIYLIRGQIQRHRGDLVKKPMPKTRA